MFSDISKDKTSSLTVDISAIHQSITAILLTNKGERIFNPEFGASIEELLFGLVDDDTALSIFNQVINDIEMYEPRIKIDMSASDIIPDPDNNRFIVSLYFTLAGIDNQIFEYKKYLEKSQ